MEAKPFASLTSGLLARKGQAKPAMRPQGFAGFGLGTPPRDDLGWNDMGYDVPRPLTPAPSLAAAAMPARDADEPRPPAEDDAPAAVPAVVRQRAELAQELAAHQARTDPEAAVAPVTPAAAAEPAPPAPAAPRAARRAPRRAPPPAPAAAAASRKAAFTLRLDADRHLRLRLATAMRNRSAQQLVTEALDQFLAAIPELDELAERVPARGTA